jgi:uncharacterized membrane protein YsdA (DUF1294 family)
MEKNERTLLVIAFLGGWTGVILGSIAFRTSYSRSFWAGLGLAAIPRGLGIELVLMTEHWR